MANQTDIKKLVQLVNEAGLGDFVKAVQQRTGIGKPGVGPGQTSPDRAPNLEAALGQR